MALSEPTTAPALVVAAVVHAELMTLQPFTYGSGLVTRAVDRLVLGSRGVDPDNWSVPEAGLHAKGWSRDRAIEYMRQNTAMGEADIVAEVERYIAEPGQALAYKIGQRRIRELRERAARALKDRFDVKSFHAQILMNGSMPLDVLDASIDRWIEANSAAAR